MNDYALSPAAEGDLEAIWQYTFHTRSADHADRYVDDLFDAFDLLGSNPKLGMEVLGLPGQYRRLHTQHHLIFYRVNRTGRVDVIRVLHERADAVSVLKQSASDEI